MNLKRIHLFEIEDQSWFPSWMRNCMTKALNVMHDVLGTNEHLPALIAQLLKETNTSTIIDLCSGGGGPMEEALTILKSEFGFDELQLRFTDLYPHLDYAEHINSLEDNNLSYAVEPFDATTIPASLKGLRTMVCSFHHMRPRIAKQILTNAHEAQQPILIYEISDNAPPVFLSLITMPITFVVCLFVTLKVRPMTWQQVVFTYLIPILPLCFAWDGAVSNVRTYTLKDMEVLLKDLQTEDYQWKTGTIAGKPSGKLYLYGMPKTSE